MTDRLSDLGLPDAVTEAFLDRYGDAEDDHAVLGRVSRVDRGECAVLVADGERRAASDSQRAQDAVAPATGDWVAIVDDPEIGEVIDHVFERRSAIVRRDPAEHAVDQVLAANIDVAVVVHGLDLPANAARIERFLVLAIDSGAEPVVVLTKADLAGDRVVEHDWLRSVAPVVVTSTSDGSGIDELRSHLGPRRTAVFLGPSGVGKSSLVNALAGEEIAETGDVREGDRRGRHTTTVRELIELPDGSLVIDTPGIRAVGLWAADIALDQVFGDIADLAEGCRFRDCTHRSEPACAVTAAVEAGEIEVERVARYQLLWSELAEQAVEIERQRRAPRPGRRRRRR